MPTKNRMDQKNGTFMQQVTHRKESVSCCPVRNTDECKEADTKSELSVIPFTSS